METISCVALCGLGIRSQLAAQAGLELAILLQLLKCCTNVYGQRVV